MAKFRRKPIVIEAIQFVGRSKGHLKAIRDFCKGQGVMFHGSELMIPTQGGNLIVKKNDWIVKDANGDLYVNNSVSFKRTYEAVED